MRRIDRAHLLPFLVVAYPVTLVVLEVRPHCRPDCSAFGPADVTAVLGAILGSLVLAALAVVAIERSGATSRRLVGRALSPTDTTVVALSVIYAAFLGFLLVDAVGAANGPWKLLPVAASFLLFAPAWTLYVATFVLAAVLPALGVGPSPGLTAVVRAIVVVFGLGGSALWQFALVEAVVGPDYQPAVRASR